MAAEFDVVKRCGLDWTVWPTLPILPEEDLRRAALAGVDIIGAWQQRERAIAVERLDPLNHGWEGAHWVRARGLLDEGSDVLILGGNRSSKTELAAKLVMEKLLERPNRNVWCFMENQMASIERQQSVVFKFLPLNLRKIKKSGQVTKISYTKANGFTENVFVLPNGSTCRFMTYEQHKNNPSSVEGGECDLIWCDELVGPDLVGTLRYRLVTRGGKLLLTFTPLEGYSVVVKEYLEGASVVESIRAPLFGETEKIPSVPLECGPGRVPYVLQPRNPRQKVICFPTAMNPYGGYENLVRELEARPATERLLRAYGWPTRQIANAFPKFSTRVSVVPHGAVPAKGTNYLSVDPGGAKNWFMVWLRVDPLGRVFVYREWPDISMGEWTEPSDKADGKPGPAQKCEAGRGILAYKRLIQELEGDEVLFERLMDPRAGAAAVPGIEDGTSIIELMADEQLDGKGVVIGPSLVFIPAPACKVDEGTALINDLLDFNQDQPVTMLNAPRLFVSERCSNLIYALQSWTGADGEKGAAKDPIDALKYAVKRGLEYVDAAVIAGVPGSGF